MDIELFYTEKGKGEPLLLLHGNGGSSEYFEHQIDYFAKEYHVIAIDTRGHGKSPRERRHLPLCNLQKICMISWSSMRLRKRIFWDFRMVEILH